MKKIGGVDCIYIRNTILEVKIMFKKIISLMAAAACVLSLSQTAFAWDSSNIVVDTSGAVQIYQVREQDKDNPASATVYYSDKDGNKLNGLMYGNFADENGLAPRLLLADFEDGKADFVYGFTKSSKGRRYYTRGERAYGWKKIDGYWYHFDTKTGYASTGKTKICGSVYEFDEKGRWTNRVSKSGFAPKDFSVSFSGGWGGGFDTAEKKIYYGDTMDGTAEADVKISARDKQILWCMFLESGFEWDCEELFTLDIAIDFLKKTMPDVDGEYEVSLPQIVRAIKVTAEGKTTEISYDADIDSLAVLEKNLYRAWLLNKQYMDYYRELEEKYPYSGDEQIFYPE